MAPTFAGVRTWMSRSEASESDLPPKDQRLPDGWDEEDIIVDEDIAPINSQQPAAKKKASPAPAAASPSPKKSAAPVAANKKVAETTSTPGWFPEGFFASPKTKKPATDFPTTAATAATPAAANKNTAASNKKQQEAAVDAAAASSPKPAGPSMLTRLAGFLMRKKDGDKGTVNVAVVAAAAGSPSPKKLTGGRRERSSSSEDEEEEDSTSGGDLSTQLTSTSAKKLEASKEITVGDLKDYARENDIKIAAKAKKGDLISACQKFAKKEAAAAANSPSKPRGASSAEVSSPSKNVAAVVAAAPATPAAKAAAPKIRKIDTGKLFATPPSSIAKGDEPAENWCVVQLKEWAGQNKVKLDGLFLKTDILKACWAAYDKK